MNTMLRLYKFDIVCLGVNSRDIYSRADICVRVVLLHYVTGAAWQTFSCSDC